MSRPVPKLLLAAAVSLAALVSSAPTASACTWEPGASGATGCTTRVPGPTYRVAPAGDDERGTGTAKAPFATVSRALRALGDRPSGTVLLAPGDYPAFLDTRPRRGTVLLRGSWAATRIGGAKLYGSQGLRFEDLAFTQRLVVNHHGVLGAQQRAARLVLDGVEMTVGCLSARNIDKLTLADSWLHDCGQGVSGPAGGGDSTNVTIAGNTIERLTSDGVMVGNYNGLSIRDNVIRDIQRLAGSTVHNDGIQLIGGVRRAVIERNVLARSTGQLLFVSDDFGANDDVAVINNLLHDAGAAAVQAGGTTRLRFIANTVWAGRYGGIILRKGYSQAVAPRVTLVNNLLQSVRFTTGAAADATGNAVSGGSAGDLRGVANPLQAPVLDLRRRLRAQREVPGALDPTASATPRTPVRRITR